MDDDRTRVKPRPAPVAEAADERTRLQRPAADDRTRLRAPRSEQPPGTLDPRTAGTSATGSDWRHPERWQSRHEGPLGPGSVIKDRFVLESVLGQGGMGVVFRAIDRRKEEARDRDPYVAVKILSEEFSKHPNALIALQ